MGKILKITEKILEVKPTTLPDGKYQGTWGGNIINIQYGEKIYELETEEGVRGIGYKVVVLIEGDNQTFFELDN